jgi:hypothetical protein
MQEWDLTTCTRTRAYEVPTGPAGSYLRDVVKHVTRGGGYWRITP